MSKTLEVKADDAVIKALDAPKLSAMKKVYAGVGELVTRLSSFNIKKTEDYDEAMKALMDAKELIKRLDGAEEKAIDTEERYVKSVKALRKVIGGPITLGVGDLKQKMGKFQADQQAKRDKEAEKLRLEALEQDKKIETADSSKQAAKLEQKVQTIEAKAEAIETFKAKTADKVRKFEVVDPEKVERKYCTPEDKKIRPFIGDVNGPIPEIPGVRIWDEFKIVTR